MNQIHAASERDPIRVGLGRELRKLRLDKGLTQVALEWRSGLDQSTISRLECGIDLKVRMSRLLTLLRALGVTAIRLETDREIVGIVAFLARYSGDTHTREG
ncbi:MAG: helix-turn-helix domain-containing protein [Chloroflexota bacterium]